MKLLIKADVYNELAEKYIEKSSHRKDKIRKLVHIHNNKGKDYWAYRLCNSNPEMAKLMGKVDKDTRDKYIKENENILTNQAFIEMSDKDKNEFINSVKKCHYYMKDGVYVAYGRKEKSRINSGERLKFKREFFAAKQLAKLGYPTYLIPEHIAKYPDDKNKDKTLADIVHNNVLTDAKHTVSRGGIQTQYGDSRYQGDNVFIEVENNRIDKNSAIRAINGKIKAIQMAEPDRNFLGKVFLYLHKDMKMYCFNVKENGWITEIKN